MQSKNQPSIRFLKTIGALGQEKPIRDLLTSIKDPETRAQIISLQTFPKLTNLEFLSHETMMAPDILRLVRESAQLGYDALVIACFFDPFLSAAREVSGDMIVVGPCQASLQLASTLSNKFSIVVGKWKWANHVTHLVRDYGYEHQLASIRSIDIPVDELQLDCAYTRERIIEEGRRAIQEDGAEALILGCTCTFGLFEEVQAELGVPVIDPTYASFKQAEFLASLKHQFGTNPSQLWSCEPPSEASLAQSELFATKANVKNIFDINSSY